MKLEYTTAYGRPIAILYRKEGEEATDECPFCGAVHFHGLPEGLRGAHCHWKKTKDQLTASDGTILSQKDGYYIKHY